MKSSIHLKKISIQSIEIFLLFTIVLSLTATVLAQGNDIYEITLNYKKTDSESSLSLVDIRTAKGPISDYKLNPPNAYNLDIISSDNQVLTSIRFVVPTGAVVLKGLINAKAQGTPDDLTFTISVPYFKNGNIINIYDKDNNKVLEIPLRQKVNIIWLYVTLPIVLIIGFLVYVEFKRKKEHIEIINKNKQQRTAYLRNYVITNLRKGYSKEQIKNALIKSGYSKNEIDGGFR